MYIRFDIILRKYKYLNKIETIGDSYMVVGNISSNNNIEECIKNIIMLGFEFIDSLKYLKMYNNLTREIRIGIHCGPIISGLLGLDIPRFCLIGNTVNYTSRLQTTSEPNKIQISEEIFEYVKDNPFFSFQKRDNIYLKNIGTKTTYLINIESKSKTNSFNNLLKLNNNDSSLSDPLFNENIGQYIESLDSSKKDDININTLENDSEKTPFSKHSSI